MTAKKHHLLSVVLLIIVLCANLLNVQLVHADGETPTEPPVATQVETDTETEPLAEGTPVPVGTLVVEEGITAPVEVDPSSGTSEAASSQETVVSENTPVAVILSEVSPETDIVVLDQEGQPLVLSSQDAADALVTSDPVWCPANVSVPTPGANNCSISYASIAELLEAMRNNPAAFDEDGTIFLEKPTGSGFTTPLILDSSANSLGGSFATLSNFNLTIRGGWNGNNPGTFSSQTVFGASGGSEGYVLIGSQQNPWIGNVTLRDLNLIGISVANAVTVYTTSGNITLNNVDVDQQTGTNYTAYLDSDSGNITVGNTSYFDGNNNGTNQNRGFYAETGTGDISITGTGTSPTFQDARGTDAANYNGATLSAPSVTLTNVRAQDNDGNGIQISNAGVVTLNNVISGVNQNGQGNGLSGVLINGNGATLVAINGGSFNKNNRYGIEILSSGNITVVSNPSYAGNGLGDLFENGTPDTNIISNPPSLTNNSAASFSFSGSDNFTSSASLTFQCSRDGAAFAACTNPIAYVGLVEGNHNFQVRAVDQAGNVDLTPANFSWIIDTTPPTISSHPSETAEATSAAGAFVNYTSPATFDAIGGMSLASCAPASGSLFDLGDTTVTCTAADRQGNTATPTTFVVHVLDTTAPVIDAHSNVTIEAMSGAGAIVTYKSPSTSDVVDGAGTADCSPASGTTFMVGNTTVTCTATDNSGNIAIPTSFVVQVTYDATPPIPASTPTNAPINSPVTTVTSLTTSASIIPITGGELIDLDCNSSFWAFGIKLTFYNLCDQQTILHNVGASELPATLPAGFSYRMGLNVEILANGQTIKNLPDGTGIQIDFPLNNQSADHLAVLYWNDPDGDGKGEWIEVSKSLSQDKVIEAFTTKSTDELYKLMTSATDTYYPSLTTDKTGIFILVKK